MTTSEKKETWWRYEETDKGEGWMKKDRKTRRNGRLEKRNIVLVKKQELGTLFIALRFIQSLESAQWLNDLWKLIKSIWKKRKRVFLHCENRNQIKIFNYSWYVQIDHIRMMHSPTWKWEELWKLFRSIIRANFRTKFISEEHLDIVNNIQKTFVLWLECIPRNPVTCWVDMCST